MFQGNFDLGRGSAKGGTMKRLRTAVIGAGRFGRCWIRNVEQSSAFRLTAVCDLRTDLELGLKDVRQVTDPRTLLQGDLLDAVIIATPPATHASLAAAALDAGLHVLCEKPLAFEAEQCERLGRLADSAGCCLMVDCTPVYLEEIERARREIRWREVSSIRCLRIGGRRPDHAVDVLWDLAPHDLAVIDSWLGDLPADWEIDRFPDGACLTAEVAEGPKLEVTVGYASEPQRRITVESATGTQQLWQRQSVPEPLQTVLSRFASAICRGERPLTDAFQAGRIAQVLQGAAHASAR